MHTGARYLETFVAAVETGSFIGAAKRLHRTQSSVSYQIKQLEEWMGRALFERSGRRVLLTEHGRLLYQYCERFLVEIEALRASLGQGEFRAASLMRIATGSSFGRYVLTPLLAAPEFRDVSVNLQFSTDDATFHAVANGLADIGFSYSMRASNILTFEPIYVEQLALITAPITLPTGKARIRWVQESAFITYDESDPVFQRWFESVFGAMPGRIRGIGHCSDVEEVVAMVGQGRGLSIVPRHAIDRELAQNLIREVVFPNKPLPANTIYAVKRETAALPEPIAALVAKLKLGTPHS